MDNYQREMEEEFDKVSFICPICSDIVIETTETNCRHQFCKYCITLWGKYSCHCPICDKEIKSLSAWPEVDLEINAFYEASTDHEVHSKRGRTLEERAAAYQKFLDRSAAKSTSETSLEAAPAQSNGQFGEGDGFYGIGGKARRRPSFTNTSGRTRANLFPAGGLCAQIKADTDRFLNRIPESFMTSSQRPEVSTPQTKASSEDLPLPNFDGSGDGSSISLSLTSYPGTSALSRSSTVLADSDHASVEMGKLERSLNQTYESIYAVGREVASTEDQFSSRYFAKQTPLEDEDEDKKETEASSENQDDTEPLQMDTPDRGDGDGDGHHMSQAEPAEPDLLTQIMSGCYSPSVTSMMFQPDRLTNPTTLAANQPGLDDLLKESRAADEVHDFLKTYTIESILESSDDEDDHDHAEDEEADDEELDHLLMPRLGAFKIHPEVRKFLASLTTKIKPRVPTDPSEKAAKHVEECHGLFRRIRHEYADTSNANDESIPMSTLLDAQPKFIESQSVGEHCIGQLSQLTLGDEALRVDAQEIHGGGDGDASLKPDEYRYFELKHSKLSKKPSE